MTTWKDGGVHDGFSRRIIYKDGTAVCCVQTGRAKEAFCAPEPWPEGEANFRLILAIPELASTLHELLEQVDAMTEYYESGTCRSPVCQKARELLGRLGMHGPPRGDNSDNIS